MAYGPGNTHYKSTHGYVPGDTPLHVFCRQKWEEAALRFIAHASLEVLKKRNDQGHSGLWIAIDRGVSEVAMALFDKGAGESDEHIATKRNPNHWTALHIACFRHDHSGVAQRLLDRGADINAVTRDHETALHLAYWSALTPHIALLKKRGADTDVRSLSGMTAVDMTDGIFI